MENNRGGGPPQEPPDEREYNEIRDSLAALGKSELSKQLTALFQPETRQQITETLNQVQATLPPEMRQHLEALGQQLRRAELAKQEAKERAEQERRKAAEEEAARQAWRASRQRIGGRKGFSPEEKGAGQAELRQHPELHGKKEAALNHLGNWFKGQGKVVSRSALQENIVWPVLGRKRRHLSSGK